LDYFGNTVPEIPKKTYLTFLFGKSDDELNERKMGLDEFV